MIGKKCNTMICLIVIVLLLLPILGFDGVAYESMPDWTNHWWLILEQGGLTW